MLTGLSKGKGTDRQSVTKRRHLGPEVKNALTGEAELTLKTCEKNGWKGILKPFMGLKSMRKSSINLIQ